MKTKHKTAAAPEEFLPEVQLATAEKVLRDIAKRNDHVLRKRRSPTLKTQLGDGYAVIDPFRNSLLSSPGLSRDACDLSLVDLAEWYKDDENNTPWQRTVIKAILAGKVA